MSEQITIKVTNPPRVKVDVNSTTSAIIKVTGKIIPGPSKDFIENEVPSGLVNGSNATFTSQYNFVPESVEVFINGLKQKPIIHYTTSGTTTIILSDSPQTGDQILINYQKG
jgi:hypothetical protein